MGTKKKDLYDEVVEAVKNLGYEIVSVDELEEILDYHSKGSLAEVVAEELPIIAEYDPLLFKKNEIKIPDNIEYAFLKMYRKEYGTEGLEDIYYRAKFWFRHIRFFLIDHPDKKELRYAIGEFKKILEGRYDELN